MANIDSDTRSIGWIGIGRMGYAMAERLASAGAAIAGRITDLAACDIVFVMVSAWKDVDEVIAGPSGLLSAKTSKPKLVVECSSISLEGSAKLRETLRERGIDLLAAPVSG